MLSFNRLTALTTIVFGSAVNTSRAVDQNITCFDNGLQADCSSFINNFCNSLQDVSMQPADAISRCYVASSTYRCELTVYHEFTQEAGSYSVPNCKTVLQNVTASCPRGGTGLVLNGENVWTINPNDGDCGANTAPEENSAY